MTKFLFIAVTALLAACQQATAQKKVCEALDDPPYLGTQPTLTFMVDEATAADLQSGGCAVDPRFRSEVRVQGGDGEYTLSIRGIPAQNPLDYTVLTSCSNTMYLQLNKPIDRDGFTSSRLDDVSFMSAVLECTPNNGDPTQVYNARFFIRDVNDNRPTFPAGDQDATISEAAELGTVVLTVSADDKDENLDKNITYKMGMGGPFKVIEETGEIILERALDYDVMGANRAYTLVITAEDGGPGVTYTATTTVNIRVTDSDDLPPAFAYPGCFKHEEVCAWPKYTTPLKVQKDTPIEVLPVPNKVKATVQIEAFDRDAGIAHEIVFSIASTIPPGHENEFRVETHNSSDNKYMARVIPNMDMTLNEGFEIFLKAEEQSVDKKHEVAMIFFTGGDDSSSKDPKDGSDDSDNNDNNNNDAATGKEKVADDDDKPYTNLEVGLIASTAILATFVFCLLIGLFCSMRRSAKGGKNNSGDLPMGQTNNGYRL